MMWNRNSSRRSMLPGPRNLRNLSPVNTNAFSPSPRQFPTLPTSSSTHAPPNRPFFRNTFTPVHAVHPVRDSSPSHVPQSSDAGPQSTFLLAKHHALHRTGGLLPLSPSEILRSPYSPGQFVTHQQSKPSAPSLEQFQNSPYLKTEVNVDKQFSYQNSPSPQNSFLSDRNMYGGIPLRSDGTADSSSPYSKHGISIASAMKQEEDSLDYFCNKHSPSDENCESTPSHSFEKGNSTLDHSVFSQKSDDSLLSEGNHGEPNVNDDSQSQSSLPISDSGGSPGDLSPSKRKLPTRLLPEDSHHGSGDSDENPCKRQKLSQDSDNESVDVQGSELEKSTREGSRVAGDSIENSSKCQKPNNDTRNDSVSVEQSELEKYITEVSEPVVGLDYLMEYKKENFPPSLYTYKCSLCNCTILAKHVLMHILSVKHRLRYLKSIDESEHQRIMKLRANQNELSSIVAGAIADLETKHGRGSVKVVCVPSSDTKNEEETLEDSFNISPTVAESSMAPSTDDLLLDKIPEPPDLKLLNDILNTAQTLQSGASQEYFQLAGTGRNEGLRKQESPEFKAETTGSKWQLGCEIPPPPPFPFPEGATSSWNQPTSLLETSPSAAATTRHGANAMTTQLLPPPTLCTSESNASQQYPSSEHGPSILLMGLPKSPIKTENSEIRDSSTSEGSDHTTSHHAVSEATFPSSDCLKLKNETHLESELEALPKIPLIDDTPDDVIEKSKTKFINIPSPFKDRPAEGTVLTEEEEELGKAAIFENLSDCTITNEAEASLIERMICTLTEMYFAYKLRDLPKSESESLLQAVHLGQKGGIEKLTSILYRHSTTDDSFSESDGNLNSYEEHNARHKNDGISSPLQSVKAEESELAKNFESDSGSVPPPPTQEDEGNESFLNSLSSHNGNEFNKSISSPSSLAGGEAKLINDNKDVAEGEAVNEAVNEKCSEENIALKDGESPQNLAELTFAPPPPPPPPPPPAESAGQTAVSEQSAYAQTSVSYGGWPMTYYPAATQAGSYMYWPSQNMGGVDPSVMNTQYMIPTQNSDTSLYSWCLQAPPPLPPPPPPPPPPPTSSMP